MYQAHIEAVLSGIGVWLRSAEFLALLTLSIPMAGVCQPRLAITEAMSWPLTNHGSTRMDFWELTNFGTEPADVENYRFTDRDHAYSAAWVFPKLSVSPGESVIFMRSNTVITSIDDFRKWWGANLPSNLQVSFYEGIGFDDKGDSVRLWDAEGEFVDGVDFDQAYQGFTFTYNTNTGEFGTISQADVCGTWIADDPRDVGSPGYASGGPVPISISQQPLSQSVDASEDVVLGVNATGRPPPKRYEWFWNGTLLQTVPASQDALSAVVNFANFGLAWVPSPKRSDLVLTNVQPSQSGDYFVVLSNGSDSVTSAVARLTVNAKPLAPYLESPPQNWLFPTRNGAPRTNSLLFLGEEAAFGIIPRGYPQPDVQWAWSQDGTKFTDLAWATERTLKVFAASADCAGVYRVQLSNALGTNYGYTRLSVVDKPPLKISEVMSRVSDHQHNCWWELTNEGEESLDLCGYVWDDSPGNIGFGPTITNDLIIEPRESIIFVEKLSRDDFVAWWGAENLPVNFKCISYNANSLSDSGEMVRVWNAFAVPGQEHEQFVASVSFSSASNYASFWFDYSICTNSEMGLPCLVGEGGAFQARTGSEIGSPGWSRFTRPAFVLITITNGAVNLQWRAQPGSINRLESMGPLASSGWTNLGTLSSSTSNASTNVPFLEEDRFYRLVQITNAVSSCP